jgi:phosphate transport system permease protein
MITMAVLPHGRSGIIASSILGLGRALGETMAVAMVLASAGAVTFVVVGSQNPSTIAANIALRFPEAHGITVNMLIGSGLVLFAITLVVNGLSRWIIAKTTVDGGR